MGDTGFPDYMLDPDAVVSLHFTEAMSFLDLPNTWLLSDQR